MNAVMRFREPAYAILSAVLAMVTLVFGMLTGFFVLAGIRGALNQAIPHDGARFNAILICLVVAIVFAFLTGVCGRFMYKCMRAANRE